MNDENGGTETMADTVGEAATAASSGLLAQGDALREKASAFAEQASDGARTAADALKQKTSVALHGLSRLLEDSASTVDTRIGRDYGDYTRQAAESVAGAARAVEGAEIDKLAADARDYVKNNPITSIGAAAVAGFLLARLAGGRSKER